MRRIPSDACNLRCKVHDNGDWLSRLQSKCLVGQVADKQFKLSFEMSQELGLLGSSEHNGMAPKLEQLLDDMTTDETRSAKHQDLAPGEETSRIEVEAFRPNGTSVRHCTTR
jgi:hypothetical protein